MGIKIWLALAVAAALGGLLYHDRHETHRANEAVARAATAEASIKTLQAAYERERANAQKASNDYQNDLARLANERSSVPVVRLCHSPKPVPAASSTTSGPDPASAGHLGDETAQDSGPDIGPALLEYGIACEANALQLDRLIQWTKSR